MVFMRRMVVAVLGVLVLARWAGGHPGSGIIVTGEGVVYFVDNSPPPPEGTGREIVWRVGKDGKLTASDAGGGHWLGMDPRGTFSKVDFNDWGRRRVGPSFVRIGPAEFGRGLLAADGQPFTFGVDGNLYFARGNLELTRLTPAGNASVVVRGMLQEADRRGGIKGVACGADGSIYLSFPEAVEKVTPDGRVSVVAEKIAGEGGGNAGARTDLRGLAVSEGGVVYAADSGGRRVVKILPDGKVTTILKSEGWMPTGVAVSGDGVYVLEFSDAPPTEWRPRVRKVSGEGKVTLVAEVSGRRG